MDLASISDNRLAISLISLVAGVLLTQIVNAIRNKSAVLGYISYFNRLGISADDQIFGSVRVNWQGQELRNLHSFAFEIENLTSTDFEKFDFEVFTGDDTILLNEKTEVVDTPYIIKWSPDFAAELTVPRGNPATEAQMRTYRHRREYHVPVFNRGQQLRLTFLCTRPNDDSDPFVGISTMAKGVKLKKLPNPYVLLKPIFGVPIPIAITRAIIFALITLILCVIFVPQVWLASIVCMIVGLVAQIFGAALYKVERLIKRAIAG